MRELIKRSIKANIILVSIAVLIFVLMRKFNFGLGLLVGTGWSTANFLLTVNLLEIAMLQRSRNKLLLLLLIKFPVLYLSGFLILSLRIFPALSLLIGMSLLLFVLGALSIWAKCTKLKPSCQI